MGRFDQKNFKENVKHYIINYTKIKINNIVPSICFYTNFCVIHSINHKELSFSSFIPILFSVYEEIYNKKLITRSLRFKKGEPAVRCVEGLYLQPASQQLLDQVFNRELERSNNHEHNHSSPLIEETAFIIKGESKNVQRADNASDKQILSTNDSLINHSVLTETITETSNAAVINLELIQSQNYEDLWTTNKINYLILKWIENSVECEENKNEFLHLLLAHFNKFYNFEEQNKSGRFTKRLVSLSQEKWPNTKIYKDSGNKTKDSTKIIGISLK